MKQDIQNIVEGNKIIHEFMKVSWMYPMDYHSSWDWIMPALKKFGDLPTDDEIRKYWNDIVNIGLASIDIKLTWKLFVEAIQWYNNQQKQVKE